MFKNLLVYRLAADWQADFHAVSAAFDRQRFVECGATQPTSLGWVPPREMDHAPLLESVAGQWLARLTIEQKIVPAAVVKREVEALAQRIEADTGRAPGRKQRRDLKDQATLDLLPRAFTKRVSLNVWLSPGERLLAIDAGSAKRADAVLSLLTDALPGFAARLIDTQQSPAAAMSDWLVAGEAPSPFTIDRDCELKAAEGEKPAVRYARHNLDLDEVRVHIREGKRPTRLALTWNGRVSFVLTEGLQIKRLAFDDGIFERQPGLSRDEAFDTDAALATGELLPLVGDLIDALGGEADELGGVAAGSAATGSAVAAPAATIESPATSKEAVPRRPAPTSGTTTAGASSPSSAPPAKAPSVQPPSKAPANAVPPWETAA